MSTARRPAAFRLDDPQVVLAPAEVADEARASARGAQVLVTPVPDAPALPAVVPAASPRKRFAWAAVFWSSLGALTLLGLGLAVIRLIEDQPNDGEAET